MEAISNCKLVLLCEGKDHEESFDEIRVAPFSDPIELFFAGRMTLLCKPNGLMFYGKLEVYFFSTSEYHKLKLGDYSEQDLTFKWLASTHC